MVQQGRTLLRGNTIEQIQSSEHRLLAVMRGSSQKMTCYLQNSIYPLKLQNPICLTYINFVFQTSFDMVTTRKRSSPRPSKKRGKVGSKTHSRSGKVNSQKRRKTTTKQSAKTTGRTQRKKRTKASDIIIKRTSGRREKFETDKMAQTVSRSGTPFLLARDVAKTVSEKVMQKGNDRASAKKEKRTSSASTIEVD